MTPWILQPVATFVSCHDGLLSIYTLGKSLCRRNSYYRAGCHQMYVNAYRSYHLKGLTSKNNWCWMLVLWTASRLPLWLLCWTIPTAPCLKGCSGYFLAFLSNTGRLDRLLVFGCSSSEFFIRNTEQINLAPRKSLMTFQWRNSSSPCLENNSPPDPCDMVNCKQALLFLPLGRW